MISKNLRKASCILILIGIMSIQLKAQELIVRSRQNYYTNEKQAKLLISLPDSLINKELSIIISQNGKPLLPKYNFSGKATNQAPIPLASLSHGTSLINYQLLHSNNIIKEGQTPLVVLPDKDNAVKIDLLTGGLIVEDHPYFPFGFYCYSPVQPTLPEEEATKGFNMISPYQKITTQTMDQRKAYMDRCAALGMKVHYNLLSIAGGGGPGGARAQYSDNEKIELLKREIETFKDHPALLGWYISDEPIGQGVPVEPLEQTYKIIKKIDPYHPVTIVFMTPNRAREYANAMDIVMTDPYPVPGDIHEVEHVMKELKKEFRAEKPIWMVPQAFGGAEHWKREPFPAEIRALTYLSILEGATAIQYFIRHGLNSFPKSTRTWNECAAMSLELQQIAPFILGGHLTEPIICNDTSLLCKGWQHNGQTLIVIQNRENKPRPVRCLTPLSEDNLNVLFQNRNITTHRGIINDYIAPYGTLLLLSKTKSQTISITANPINLVHNASFEDNPSPEVPSGCYAGLGTDRGATYFTDPQQSVHGTHSIRLITPKDSAGVHLSFFPVQLKENYSYSCSIWAKASATNEQNTIIELALGTIKSVKFNITHQWKKYSFIVHMDPSQTVTQRANPQLELKTKGKAWVDLLEVFPNPTIHFTALDDQGKTQVSISNSQPNTNIHYTLNEKVPTVKSSKYRHPFYLKRSATLSAAIFQKKKMIAICKHYIPVHRGLGKPVTYKNHYSPKYAAGGDTALVDGQLGSASFRDGHWQGFEGNDMDLIVDLGKAIRISKVKINFLNDKKAGIYLPAKIHMEGSLDGQNYYLLQKKQGPQKPIHKETFIKKTVMKIPPQKIRYLHITAKNIETIPKGYMYAGTKAWLFMDEIEIQ